MRVRRESGKAAYKILGVLAGAAFIVGGINERSEYTKLTRLGQMATVDPVQDYTQFKNGGTSVYTAQFHFKTSAGNDVTAKHSFPEEVLDDFKAGRPVRILYMPNDPTDFRFERDKPGWLMVIGGVALAIAALIFA